MNLPTIVVLDDYPSVTREVAFGLSQWSAGRFAVQAFNRDDDATNFVTHSKHCIVGYIQDLCRNPGSGELDGLTFWANIIRIETPRARTIFYSGQLAGHGLIQRLPLFFDDLVRFVSKFDLDPLSKHFDWLVSDPRLKTVFLSHSHADKRFVRSLAKMLESNGISVWIDEAEIKIGESLTRKLADAINQVDLVVAVISHASIQSEWVQRELDLAINHEIANRVVKVLPVVLDDCKLPGFLVGKLYADFRNKRKRKYAHDSLIKAINTYKLERQV